MSLAVTEYEAAFVESLVGSEGHLEVVPHTHEEDAALRKVDCGLPNDLIEKLIVYLFSDRTDATFTGLLLYQFG